MSSDEPPTRPGRLYEQVANILRRGIYDGHYKAGDRIPSEARLVEQYEVSRNTIREAITLLEGEGLVEVEHGRGTFVRSTPIRLPVSALPRHERRPGEGPWETACGNAGITGRTEMISVDRLPATDDVAAGLGVPVGTEVVRRLRRMLADDVIHQIQEGFLPFHLVEGTVLARAEKVVDGIYAALDEIGRAPARFTEEVSARMPTSAEAKVLGTKTGVPIIQVTRTTYDATGQPVEWLVVTAAADRNLLVYRDLPLS